MEEFLEECASRGRYVDGYFDDILTQEEKCEIDEFFLGSDTVGKRKTKKLLKSKL